MDANSDTKPNAKLKLMVKLDGYTNPVEKSVTLATVSTKPTLALNRSSSTINTNELINPISEYYCPYATGLKTGFTSGAGYCLSATAEREGMELVAVVMGAETSKGRNAACKQLLDYGFANYALVQPEIPEISSVPVKLGVTDSVNAVPAKDGKMLIDKGQKNLVTTEVQLDEEVTAPVSKGQRLGTMTVKAGEQILAEIPMVAESGVEKLTWVQMYLRLLKKICMK